MKITVELSLYPFNTDYKTLIRDFIAELNTRDGLQVITTPTASMVHGDYDLVMDTLRDMIAWSYEKHGREVLVAKFIPGHDLN